jgi:hypothetical protein
MRIPMKPLLVAAMALMAIGAGSPVRPASALGASSTIDSRVRLDWEVGAGHAGRPVIQGYVYNDYGRPRTCACWSRPWTPPARLSPATSGSCGAWCRSMTARTSRFR